MLENYTKTVLIEARTLDEMLTKDFLPAVNAYAGETAKNAASKKAFLPELATGCEEALVSGLTEAYGALTEGIKELKALIAKTAETADALEAAKLCHSELLVKMEALAEMANKAEALIPDSYLPYPTYDQLLFSL